jgi:hypothetical protein
MTCGEDEAITVHPAGCVWMEIHALAEKDGADLGASERQPEVTGVTSVDRVHGEAAGFVSGGGKCCSVHSGEKTPFGSASAEAGRLGTRQRMASPHRIFLLEQPQFLPIATRSA